MLVRLRSMNLHELCSWKSADHNNDLALSVVGSAAR